MTGLLTRRGLHCFLESSDTCPHNRSEGAVAEMQVRREEEKQLKGGKIDKSHKSGVNSVGERWWIKMERLWEATRLLLKHSNRGPGVWGRDLYPSWFSRFQTIPWVTENLDRALSTVKHIGSHSQVLHLLFQVSRWSAYFSHCSVYTIYLAVRKGIKMATLNLFHSPN